MGKGMDRVEGREGENGFEDTEWMLARNQGRRTQSRKGCGLCGMKFFLGKQKQKK